MRKYPLFFALLLIASCKLFHKKHSPYKGYSTTDGITYYRYCDMGATRKQAKKGNIAEAFISYATMKDSVFWSSRDKGFPYAIFLSYSQMANGCTYEHEMLTANNGDSLIYIVPADSIFKHIFQLPLPYFIKQGDMMKVHVRINAILDSAQYQALAKTINEYKKNMDIQEQVTLMRYVTEHNIADSLKHDNMYIIPIHEGTGPTVKKGDMVSLAYTGRFLNGTLFDSVPLSAPMQFRYGDTAQVIEGLAIAIKFIHEGGEAKIIIPSQLAFGNNGSSTGIVPPYTTVVYEVTLLKVKAL